MELRERAWCEEFDIWLSAQEYAKEPVEVGKSEEQQCLTNKAKV